MEIIKVKYKVNLRNAETTYEIHRILKDSFNFPEYYGMNMDAFWDCITCDIGVPSVIYIEGFNSLPEKMNETKEIFKELLAEAVEWYKEIDMKLEIVYIG